MESKTDIGKAFRERLDQLHRQPGDSVWESIRGDLDKAKPKGKVLPFWAQLTTVAAVLLLTGIITYPEWQNYVPHIYIEMPGEANNNVSPETIVAKESEKPAEKENSIKGAVNDNANDVKASASQYVNELPKYNEDVAGATQSGIRTKTKKPANTITVRHDQIGSQDINPKVNPAEVNEPDALEPVSGSPDSKNQNKPDSNQPGTVPAPIDLQADPVYRNYRNNDSSIPKDADINIKPITKDSIM